MSRAALVLILLGACTSTPPPCELANGGAIPAEQFRDPSSGQCETVGSPEPCDPSCGLCPEATPGADLAPDWATCGGTCDALSETACLATPACHAAYQDDSAAHPVFWGCWDVPPSGAIEGSCVGLDAQTCSEHDDCTSLYTGPVNQPADFVPSFESCQPESAAAACSTLTDEAACASRADCTATYVGTNCTCEGTACTCQTQTFQSCE